MDVSISKLWLWKEMITGSWMMEVENLLDINPKPDGLCLSNNSIICSIDLQNL